MLKRILLCTLTLATTLAFQTPIKAEETFKVTSFAPQGDVRNAQQVHIRFNEAVVAFGDPRDRKAPFTTNCAQPAQSRWVDAKNWAYEFKDPLPGGLRCDFTARKDLKSKAGKKLSGTTEYHFTTGGPNILTSWPRSGFKEISSDQVFILALNAPVDRASILKHAYFEVEGIASRVDVDFLTADEVQEVVDNTYYFSNLQDKPKVGLKAKLAFPAGKKVSLIWGKDIQTPSGIKTGAAKNQVLNYTARPPFTVSLRCRRKDETQGCDPLGDIRLFFTSYVEAEQTQQITLTDNEGNQRKVDAGVSGITRHALFRPPFAPNTRFTVDIPESLRSTDGAALETDTSALEISTGDYPALAKFSGRFGILELEDSPVLPITVRNLEPDLKVQAAENPTPKPGIAHRLQEMIKGLTGTTLRLAPDQSEESAQVRKQIISYMRTTDDYEDHRVSVFKESSAPNSAKKSLTIPQPKSKNRTEVIGIPLEEPGFYVVEVASKNLATELLHTEKEQPEHMYVATGALVTNMSVHMKKGRENALFWVTQLNTASPVEGATVAVVGCDGEELWQGTTNKDGVVMTDTPLEAGKCGKGWSDYDQGLFVFAEKAGDLSFVHSSWQDGISTWRFAGTYHSSDNRQTPLIGHTVLDRSLLRAGETVSMKHFLRRHQGNGIALSPNIDDWKVAEVVHTGSDKRFTFPLNWSGSGAALTTWDIPKTAKLGTYNIYLKKDAKDSDYQSLLSGSFDVQEFKIPLTKGIVKGPNTHQVRTTTLPLDLSVQYLAGGGVKDMPVQLRTEFKEVRAAFTPKGHPSYRFNQGVPSLKPWNALRRTLGQTALKLDDKGMAQHIIADIPSSTKALNVTSEMSYRDPNGNIRTVIHRQTVHPSNLNVGVKAGDWIAKGDALTFSTLVLDLDGKPIANQPVSLDLVKQDYISHRKKLAGGVYGYEHEVKLTPLGQFCTGTTDNQGRFDCTGKTDASGNIYGVAKITDNQGVDVTSHASTWVPGDDRWWFNVADSDQMDILTEKRTFEPGDTANVQVRMPFKSAQALVTVEREGVLDYFVQKLDGTAPVVDVPIAGNYAPNAYVSVLAVRGRAGDIKPTAMVDLGRPSFKMGMTEIEVGWQHHRLDVSVETDKPVYEVRDTAKVTIQVSPRNGKPLPKQAELAIAAVDAGLLELKSNKSWNLLQGMMGLRGNETQTSTAQMQVVGKRHYGQKAVSDGGGGGMSSAREIFDTLLLWRGVVKLDDKGQAVVDVPLNDSLTKFKIVAIASAGGDLFGTGSTSITTTQSLMVFPGIAPLVREGDRIDTPITLRNTTKEAMELNVAIKVDGLNITLPDQNLTLGAGESKIVNWELLIPHNQSDLAYEVRVTSGEITMDLLRFDQKVIPAHPVRTLQATLNQLTQPLSFTTKMPDGVIEGRGGVRVDLSNSLVDGGLGGVIAYMKNYPYTCFEQTTSKALTLDDKAAWDQHMARLDSYIDQDGLVKYFPNMRTGNITLSAYILATAQERGWALPGEPKNRIVSALKAYVTGRLRHSGRFVDEYRNIIKLQALEALSRYKAATPQMLQSLDVIPQNLPTSALVDWVSILHRVDGIKQSASLREQAVNLLRSRIRFDGRIMRFTTGAEDNMWWFMVGGNANANRLVSIALEFKLWPDDHARLIEGALARQEKGHWQQTTANALGALALRKFASVYETEAVTGTTQISLDNVQEQVTWEADENAYSRDLPWASTGKDQKLNVDHQGTGAPWASVLSRAALPFSEAFNAGFQVNKTVSAITQRTPDQWSVGDEIRVRLSVKSPAPMTWVAINDPVPAGATIMGRGLGGESALAQSGESSTGGAYLAYKEQAFDGLRAYYSYVSQGEWSIDYTYRLNTAGTFQLPATRVEALYKPEMFGALPNATLVVHP